MDTSFLNVQNFRSLYAGAEARFAEEGIDTSAVPLRRILYKAMTDVENNEPGLGAAQKNSMAVDIVTRFYRELRRASIESDQNRMRQQQNQHHQQQQQQHHQHHQHQHHQQQQQTRSLPPFANGGTEELTDARDVSAALEDIIRLRDADPKDSWPPRSSVDRPIEPPSDFSAAAAAQGAQPPPQPVRFVQRYVIVDGADRDWRTHPARFEFSCDITNGGRPLGRIRKATPTCIIIPREVTDVRQTPGFTFVPSSNYTQASGLPHPYATLCVRELASAYYGSNPAAAAATAHFVFAAEYTSPNGRAYIRLKPMQREELRYDFNQLSALHRLSVSVQQPGGDLLNSSRDDHAVRRVQYDRPTSTMTPDRERLTVELFRHFDVNQFFKGDVVRFSAFPDEPAEEDGDAASAVELAVFINRASGHRVLDVSSDNITGTGKSFTIQAPGAFNEATGCFDIDERILAALSARCEVSEPPTDAAQQPLARVMNRSLQVSVSITFEVEETDARVSDHPSGF